MAGRDSFFSLKPQILFVEELKMKKLIFSLLLIAALSLSVQAGIIGTWENNSGDGWTNGSTSIGPMPQTLSGITYQQSTIGATDGSYSLEISGVTGSTHCLKIGLNTAHKADFLANNTFSIEFTAAPSEVGGWNQIYNVALNSQNYGWHDMFATSPAVNYYYWTGSPLRTTTLTFDYTAAKAVMTPSEGWIEIIFALNSGSGTDSHAFYLDNAVLTPEPATMSLLCLGALALLRKRS